MNSCTEKLISTFSTSLFQKLIGIICAASLPFLSTLEGDFVFDDSEAIVKNQDVISESWSRPFFNDFWGSDIQSETSHKSYRPLTILSFRLNYLLNSKELSSTQFKATNLLFHVANCLLVWRTFEVISRDCGIKKCKLWYMDISYLAALLFAVHPVHVEAVCGIVGRADILACITFLLAFLCYRNSMEESEMMFLYTIAAVILAGVSMLFKENGITVGGFCLSYELILWFQRKYSIKSKSKKPTSRSVPTYIRMMRLAFFTLCIMTLLCGRWIVMGGTKPVFKAIDNPAAFSNNWLTKILTYNYIYFLNFLLFVWPEWLCYDWSMGCVPLLKYIWDYRIIFVLLLYLYGMLLLRTVYIKRRTSIGRLTLIAALLIVIPFLPAANILYPVGFVVAERILYIPSLGYCLLVAIGLQRIRGIWKGKITKVKTWAFLTLLLLYALKSWDRSMDWENEYELFLSAYPVCPLNAKVRYNIAKVVDAKKDVRWAEKEYREAIRLYPRYYQAMNNLATLLKHKKQYAEAEKHLINAVSLKKDFAAAWMNLGIVMASQQRFEEAQTAYDTALSYRKNYADCYFNLGIMYLETDRMAEATEYWQRALSIDKTHAQAWTNTMALLDNTGQMDKALSLIPEALSVLPNTASINFAVANIYGKLDRYEEAEAYFLKAIQLFGDEVQPVHYSNFGVLYHRWKKYDEAEEMYKKALKLNPRYESTLSHLESLKRVRENDKT